MLIVNSVVDSRESQTSSFGLDLHALASRLCARASLPASLLARLRQVYTT